MNEQEIRSLPNEQLIQIKEKLIANIIGENMTSQDVKRLEKLEASVSALIAAFTAAEEEQAEEEKKEVLKAEEEEKLQAEEEAEKMVPVSKVAEEEEAKGEEEEKEEEEKVEKLEAQIKQLMAYVASKGKQTPGTPEDEPAMTTHKIPKISNEPVPSKKPKDGEKLFQTPSMKPGKIKAAAGRTQGQSTAFTGANVQISAQDLKVVEQTALDEVFGFAASRGVRPVRIEYNVKAF